MKVRFNTSEWESSNGGRKPRGRGNWMFRNQCEFFAYGAWNFQSGFVTFTEARKAATA